MKYKMATMRGDAEEAIPMNLVIANASGLPSKEKIEMALILEKKNVIERNTNREINELRNNSINRKGE